MRRWALFLLVLLLTGAVAAACLLKPGFAAQDRSAILSGASGSHPAGTDALGRDRLTRMSIAALLGLGGAASASAGTVLLAGSVGMLAAFAPPAVSALLLLLCDAFLAIPWLFLVMMVRSGLPLTLSPLRSAAITYLLLGSLGWPACARAVHAGAASLCSADWLVHARASGLRFRQLATRHMLPHAVPLLLPQFLLCIPAYAMSEASLGTLGLGVSEPLPSWGSMLFELNSSPALATSHWMYLPLVVLVLFLALLQLLTDEQDEVRA